MLLKRYDRPRLIHQAHVRAIVEIPTLKEGNGKELRRLHDVLSQHLRALRAMSCEPSGCFITSLIELKLDPTTAFKWQRHTQDERNVPHFQMMLDFLDVRAQATESVGPDGTRRTTTATLPMKSTTQVRSAYLADAGNLSVACSTAKHPLYMCRKFKMLPTDQRNTLAREKGLCLNCLKPGHFRMQCPSPQKCQKCQRSHHTLLRQRTDKDSPVTGPNKWEFLDLLL